MSTHASPERDELTLIPKRRDDETEEEFVERFCRQLELVRALADDGSHPRAES